MAEKPSPHLFCGPDIPAPIGVHPSQGVVENLSLGAMRASMALPDVLDDIGGSLAVIALYFRRKGEAESLWTPEDIPLLDGEPLDDEDRTN